MFFCLGGIVLAMDPKDRSDEELVAIGGAGGPQGAHIEMMRRLKVSIDRFSTGTEKASKIQIALAVVMIVVAIVQILIAIAVSSLRWQDSLLLNAISVLVIFACVWIIFRAAMKK